MASTDAIDGLGIVVGQGRACRSRVFNQHQSVRTLSAEVANIASFDRPRIGSSEANDNKERHEYKN